MCHPAFWGLRATQAEDPAGYMAMCSQAELVKYLANQIQLSGVKSTFYSLICLKLHFIFSLLLSLQALEDKVHSFCAVFCVQTATK